MMSMLMQEDEYKRNVVRENGGHIVKWERLESGVIKLNTDAAFNENERLIGIGVIERDHEGKALEIKALPRN